MHLSTDPTVNLEPTDYTVLEGGTSGTEDVVVPICAQLSAFNNISTFPIIVTFSFSDDTATST